MFYTDIRENQRLIEDFLKKDNNVIYYLIKALVVSKNMPPVAGGISWARSIFYRIKRPIIKFLTKDDTLDKDLF